MVNSSSSPHLEGLAANRPLVFMEPIIPIGKKKWLDFYNIFGMSLKRGPYAPTKLVNRELVPKTKQE